MIRILLCILLATAALTPAIASQAEKPAASPGNCRYVINPETGDDSNPPGKPWRTFKNLNATRLAAGDIVEIAPGRQEGSLILSGEGTKKNPVVIRFLPGTHVIGKQDTVRLPLFVSNGTYLRIVEKKSDHELLERFEHPETYGFAAFVPGDEVAVLNADSLREYDGSPRGKIKSVERVTDKDWLLGFEGAVSEFQTRDLVDNITWNPDITISNNKVDMNPVRGFLLATRGKILITNNQVKSLETSS